MADYALTGDVAVTEALGGSITPALVGDVAVTVTLAVVAWTLSPSMLQGDILSQVGVVGTFRIDRNPTSDAEGLRAELGFRPITPLVVNSITVETTTDVSDAMVPYGGCFLMDPDYVPAPGDGLYDYGALPGSIGMIVGSTPLVTHFTFRKPDDNEVVWFIDQEGTKGLYNLSLDELYALTLDELYALLLEDVISLQTDYGFYKWDGTLWQSYKSIPERAFEGMRLFEATDPDDVYLYYARLMGAVLHGLTRDATSFYDLRDPDRCPEDLLIALIAQTGMYYPADEGEAMRRRRVRTAVTRSRNAGLVSAVSVQLAILGYSGYTTEVWVDPTDVNNWTAIGDAPAATKADALARGVYNDIDPDSGEKGADWYEAPHGYWNAAPIGYYLSSRVVVHVNKADGGALDAELVDDLAAALRQLVARNLALDCLPAHVSIRMFATDVPVSGGGGGDAVGVTDGLTVTEV